MILIEKNVQFGRNKRVYTGEALKNTVILANFFALLPVDGVRKGCFKFRWKSWKVLYTLTIFSAVAVVALIGFYHLFSVGSTFPQFVENIFYTSALTTSILFLHLAQVWPSLITEWNKLDISMERKYGHAKFLDFRLKLTTCILLSLATVEYSLSIAFHVYSAKQVINTTLSFHNYYLTNYPQFFDTVQITYTTGCLLQVVSLFSTFSWNYNDLFIILLSSALAVRFRQFTKKLRYHDNTCSLYYWTEMREDYNRISNLCRTLDNSLKYLVVNSFATNLFFILVQLFNSLRVITDPVEKVYFFYSFAYLVIRTVTVSLYAAWINDESKEPTHILNSLPSSCYNNEVRRLLFQINGDNVALTGCKMFKVTRGLILNVAGAIVTYELVLIQFNNRQM